MDERIVKRNEDPAFIGVDALKRRHAEQVAAFEAWAAAGDWQRFHWEHYDWWAFPVDRRSSFGMEYVVYEYEAAELKRDDGFVGRYVRGVELVAASWGWDVQGCCHLPDLADGQGWHDWPVRLYKAAQSSRLFGFDDLFASLQTYALELMGQGRDMTYNGRDLSWLFTTGVEPPRRAAG